MLTGCFICDVEREHRHRLFQTDHWSGHLADEQGYLGHTYINLRRHCDSLSNVTGEEWAELHQVIKRFERAVCAAFNAQVFNWVCLMNDAFKVADPKTHVHWKVRPRYDHPITIGGIKFLDPNFAHHYDKSHDRDHVAPTESELRFSIERAIMERL